MPSFKSEEQLQLVEREEIDGEEDLFEAIDKRIRDRASFFRKLKSEELVEREEIKDEEDLFEAIDKRNDYCRSIALRFVTFHGINAGDVEKLQDAGIYTSYGLMMHTEKSLTGIKGLSETKVDKICEAAEKIVNFGYITGNDALLWRKAVVRITTGIQAFDELLAGGLETLEIIEAFGEFRSGKTQLAHTLCFTTQIVDSVALFPVDFTGRGELGDLQQKLAQMLSRLVKIAEEFNVYKTNEVIADPGGGVFISDPKKPAGGHVFAHAVIIRLMFRKGKGEQRVCKVFNAPNLPEAEEISSVTAQIIYARAYCYEHLYHLILGLVAKISKGPFQILILYSVMPLLRVDFTGKGELAGRQVVFYESVPAKFMKGETGKVAYIDSEGTFRPDHIVPIAERFGMDPGAVLDNYNLLLGLAAKMTEEPFRLQIVDSVIALFRVDFTGRGEPADRQGKLAQMLSHQLIKIAEEFIVAVYMTNQAGLCNLLDTVIADPGGGLFISDPKKPPGGLVLAHAATISLMCRKCKGEQRKEIVLITNGNQALDIFCAGGTVTQAITEAMGESRSGETQFACGFCVAIQLPVSMTGGTGTFLANGIVPVAETFVASPPDELDILLFCDEKMEDIDPGEHMDVDEINEEEGDEDENEDLTLLCYFKDPLEVRSREADLDLHKMDSFSALYAEVDRMVYHIETPAEAESNREPDGLEALASFITYYLYTPPNIRDLAGQPRVQIFYDSADGVQQYLSPEEVNNMNFNLFRDSVYMLFARPPSERWYSEVWVA